MKKPRTKGEASDLITLTVAEWAFKKHIRGMRFMDLLPKSRPKCRSPTELSFPGLGFDLTLKLCRR